MVEDKPGSSHLPAGGADTRSSRRGPVKIYTARGGGSWRDDLRELWAHRELLWNLALRDIKIRYKQSLLGVAWAIVQPLSMTLIFTVVFTIFFHVNLHNGVPYPLFAYVALLAWTYFANSLTFANPSLTNNSSLLTKIYFPREVFPLGVTVACLFDFMMGLVVLAGMLVFYHVPLTGWLLALPLIVIVQTIFTGTVGMILSAVMVFFRDLRFVVPLLLQLWLYASPVIYPITSVPGRFRVLYALNPMVGLIDAYRQTIIYGRAPDWMLLGIALAVALVLLLAGYRGFKWAEGRFADVV